MPGASISFSEPFEDWIADVDYSVFADGERVSVENTGGEIRYHVAWSEGRFVLTGAERAAPDEFILETGSMVHVERYLTAEFGWSRRARRDLPRILVPFGEAEAAPGFEFLKLGDGRTGLRRTSGTVVDVRFADSYVHPAVQFSYFADADLADLRQSWDSPDGAPLFSKFVA